MLYLEKEVFELISPIVYFAGGVESDAASPIGFAIIENDAVSAIGFVCQRFELLNSLHDYQISKEDLNYLNV